MSDLGDRLIELVQIGFIHADGSIDPTVIADNALALEREQLAAQLEREQFNANEGQDAEDRAYRRGWNARAVSVVQMLRAK